MSADREIAKALCETLVAITEREKKKALQSHDYADALIASFIEGLFREAEKSLK